MSKLKQVLPKGLKAKDVVFACVGTDRSTGDALGPLVGTRLKQLGYDVRGTLEKPMHATNIDSVMETVADDKVVIGVDACLGSSSRVGMVKAEKGPLRPGAGVGKDLTHVGDYNIVGIVNVGGFMEYYVLQNTRLFNVLKLVDEIVDQIQKALPLHDWYTLHVTDRVVDSNTKIKRRKKVKYQWKKYTR
ncbi:hypothetical protein D3C73_945480 [compost metagenome]